MNRLRQGKAGLALVVSALLAAGCSAAGGAGAVPADAPPKPGGTLTFATDADPGCLDPQQSATAASQLISRGVVDSLVAQDPRTLEIKPWLAQSWEVSPDATTFTFHLRDGVTFSDGTPFDAAAVKANLDRIVDPATKSLLAASLLTGYAGTTVPDVRTVIVRFSAPNAPFLQAASTAFLGMESPASFAPGPQALCQKVIGSGPFVLGAVVPQQSIELDRRAGYAWAPPTAGHQGAVYLDKVAIKIVPENGVRLGSLRSGEFDAVANVPPRDAGSLTGDFQVLSKQQPGLAYSLLLNTGRGVLTDPVVRQAIAKSINTEQIVSTLYEDRYPRAKSILTPTTPGYADVLDAGQFDPGAAERALDQAGWVIGADGTRSKNGTRLSVEWTYSSPAREQRDVLAQLVQQQLKAVGIEVRLNPLPAGETISRQLSGNVELSDMSFVRADGDVLRSAFYAPQGGKPAFTDPQLARELTDATSTTDPARRASDYAQAQRLAVDAAIVIPIYDPTYLLGVSGAARGIAFDPQGLPEFYDAWVAR
ncbi:MAG TPA: ABC transporter substrate-binding protein [Amycolatopsis sp.]|nr:ABC transporter substrate-binding protein [Amycolatopsis sp.]